MGARDPVVARLAALKGELESVGAELARRAVDVEARARSGARRAAADFAGLAEEAEAKARAAVVAHPLALVAGCLFAGFVLGKIWRRR